MFLPLLLHMKFPIRPQSVIFSPLREKGRNASSEEHVSCKIREQWKYEEHLMYKKHVKHVSASILYPIIEEERHSPLSYPHNHTLAHRILVLRETTDTIMCAAGRNIRKEQRNPFFQICIGNHRDNILIDQL